MVLLTDVDLIVLGVFLDNDDALWLREICHIVFGFTEKVCL